MMYTEAIPYAQRILTRDKQKLPVSALGFSRLTSAYLRAEGFQRFWQVLTLT
jgi:hypothetical protein